MRQCFTHLQMTQSSCFYTLDEARCVISNHVHMYCNFQLKHLVEQMVVTIVMEFLSLLVQKHQELDLDLLTS